MFVKICGITREDDALLAVAMGADAVGFVFAPSKRQIAPSIARDIVKRLPPDILTVGVFRDEAPSRVVDIVNSTGLRAAQLHGHESPEDSRLIRARIPLIFKAFAAGDRGLDRADDFGADALLIDSPIPGSGVPFDWTLAEGLPRGHRVILAGGLTPENVASAISQVGPWGVDVASGVEAERGEPGQKDARKVKAFIDAAKAAVPAERADGPDPAGTTLPYDWMEDDIL
ncbi:MAG: trpF [Acidimicrobiales bacterium]|nr:trpF [Acidimicrobiales bacterium]